MKVMRQIKVTQGTQQLVTNVEDHPKLKKGSRVELPELGDELWDVVWVAEKTRESKLIKTKWNNNI